MPTRGITRRSFLKSLVAAAAIAGTADIAEAAEKAAHALTHNTNPIINPPKRPLDAPAFDVIRPEHIEPAMKFFMAKADKALKAIKENTDPPTFENTIEAIEAARHIPDSPYNVSQLLGMSLRTDELMNAYASVSTQYDTFTNSIFSDKKLYGRVQTLVGSINQGKALSADQQNLLDRTLTDFVRNGAQCAPDQRGDIGRIHQKIAEVSAQFDKNVDESKKSFSLMIPDGALLDGLDEQHIKLMAKSATEKGNAGMYEIKATDLASVITCATNREMRRQALEARESLAADNDPVIMNLLKLREEKARLMGFDSHADFVLVGTYASSGSQAAETIDLTAQKIKPKYENLLKELTATAKKEDNIDQLHQWDIDYYYKKFIDNKYDALNIELEDYEIKTDRAIDTVFAYAEQRFGLKIKEAKNKYPVHTQGIRTFEIYDDSENKMLGVIYGDFYSREGKAGSFMNAIRSDKMKDGKPVVPLINVHVNTQSSPQFELAFNKVRPLFHEVGHAIHYVLRQSAYTSLLEGTMSDDFIEFFSQANEVQLSSPILRSLYRHKETGEPLPERIASQVREREGYGNVLETAKQLYRGSMDITLHTTPTEKITSLDSIESSAMKQVGYPAEITFKNRRTLSHCFGGGMEYAANFFKYTMTSILAEEFKARMNPETRTSRENQKAIRDVYSSVTLEGQKAGIDAIAGKPQAPSRQKTFLSKLGL